MKIGFPCRIPTGGFVFGVFREGSFVFGVLSEGLLLTGSTIGNVGFPCRVGVGTGDAEGLTGDDTLKTSSFPCRTPSGSFVLGVSSEGFLTGNTIGNVGFPCERAGIGIGDGDGDAVLSEGLTGDDTLKTVGFPCKAPTILKIFGFPCRTPTGLFVSVVGFVSDGFTKGAVVWMTLANGESVFGNNALIGVTVGAIVLDNTTPVSGDNTTTGEREAAAIGGVAIVSSALGGVC
jgi:hypothetical protein